MPLLIKSTQTKSAQTKSVLIKSAQRGVSLIELIVFIVVVSIALLALVGVYQQATVNNTDPIIRLRALESAQSLLDEIIALKYDEATPTGGIPACSTASASACTNTPDNNMNDVDDYHLYSDEPYANYRRSVSVTAANNIKLITVSVTTPTGETFLLSAERANF
jgi:MSHA pilin protein MshD